MSRCHFLFVFVVFFFSGAVFPMSLSLHNQTRLCIAKARIIEVTTERHIHACQLTARNADIVCPLLKRHSIVLIQLTSGWSFVNLYRQTGDSRFQVADYRFRGGACDADLEGNYHCTLVP